MATLLSGRYIEINMLPLSFKEWYGAEGGDKRDAFNRFFRFGGFPYALNIKDQRTRRDYIQGIYNTILLKDVVRRKHIGDAELLERLCLFLFDNIGSLVSTKKIADSINTQGRRASPVTIEGYIGALLDAYLFYRASRYDVKGKKYLKSLEKYYLVDMGFRNLLPAGQNQDRGYMLENIVYLELARRGWTVHLGKAGEREIDFVARRHEELRYYQVAATALENTVLEREMLPLRTVKDNYPSFS
jgi:predicted AAA+ superfamily ATPase